MNKKLIDCFTEARHKLRNYPKEVKKAYKILKFLRNGK